jgi:MFS family permease
MSRKVAVIWHASFSIAAGVLYFFFVLPRWWELLGDTSPTLGTVLRIVTGALIGLAALPVVFTLLRTRRPEFGTPQLALNLRTASIALHVLAGVLIIGTAVSEIWLDLDSAGQWLFGIYGAAAAIALLAMFAFYLAFVAEMPPPPPKPLKPKEKRRRGRRKAAGAAEEAEKGVAEAEEEPTEQGETPADTEQPAESEKTEEEPTRVIAADDAAADESPADEADTSAGGLRNRRPAGRSLVRRRRKRSHGGVAVED